MKLINRLLTVTLAAAMVASSCLGMNNQVCCINNIANFITPLSNTYPSFGFNNKNAFNLNKLQATKQDGALAVNVNAKVKELAQSFGHKSANLEILQSYVANDKNLSTLLQLTGVTVDVPQFQPISNAEILNVLKSAGCEVEQEVGTIIKGGAVPRYVLQSKTLGMSGDNGLQNQKNIDEAIQNKALPKEMLEEFVALGNKIEKTCNQLATDYKPSYFSLLWPGNWFAEQTITEKIEKFIIDVTKVDPKAHLMVRSTGGGEDTESKEDGKTGGSNAGGNETAVNVKPTVGDVLKAIGYVLKSYFSEKSLNQRIAAGDRTLFSKKAFVPVLLQRMIGEKQGGTDNKEKIPTSCVVYVTKAGSSRVTTQCTKGHGEAVVNSMLPVDTTDSDDAYKSLKNSVISKKSVRLVPDKKGLVLKKNPTDLVLKNSLDKKTSMAIDLIARHIEKLYGKSMDIELVYDPATKTVWLVQARPLNLPEAKPSFIENLEQINEKQKLAIDSTVVGGNNSVIHIDNKKQVISAKTLDAALEAYNTMQERTNVKLVIVDDQNASSTSHAAAIFRENSIIVVVGNTQEAISWLEKENVSLYVDPQQEAIVGATDKEASIKDGYCSYPMPLKLSMPNIQEQKNKEKNDCTIKPQEQTLEQLVTTIKSGAQKEATQAYKAILCKLQNTKDDIQTNLSLPQTNVSQDSEYIKALANSIWHFISRKKTSNTIDKTLTQKLSKNAIKKLKRLQLYAQELADDVMQATTQKPYSLERLYPIRILESILFQKENNGLVNAISYYNVLNRYHDNKNFVTTTIARLIKENKLTQNTPIVISEKNIAIARTGFDASITDEQADGWLVFLDYALREKQTECKKMLETLKALDIFSAWINTEFYNAMKKYSGKDLFIALNEQIQQDQKTLEFILHKKQLVSTIPIDLIAQPDKFDKVLKLIDNVIKEFTSKEFIQLVKQNDASLLTTIALVDTMKVFVATFDTTIKNLKSPLYLDKNKLVKNFKIILQKYFDVMWTWKDFVPQNALAYNHDWPFNTYYDKFKDLFDKIQSRKNLTPSTLLPSNEFNVLNSVIGAATNFAWYLPITFEDFFMLIHQNLLKFIGVQLKIKTATKALPITSCANKLATELAINKNIKETSISFGYHEIKKSYNLPLNNHSAEFEIEYTKKSTIFSLIFKGNNSNHCSRWDRMIFYMQFLFNLRNIHMIDSKIDDEEMITRFSINDQSDLTDVDKDISTFVHMSMDYRNIDQSFPQIGAFVPTEKNLVAFQNIIQNFIRQKFAPYYDILTSNTNMLESIMSRVIKDIVDHCNGNTKRVLLRKIFAVAIENKKYRLANVLFDSPANKFTETFDIDWLKKSLNLLIRFGHGYIGVETIFQSNPQKHAFWLVNCIDSALENNHYSLASWFFQLLFDKKNELLPILGTDVFEKLKKLSFVSDSDIRYGTIYEDDIRDLLGKNKDTQKKVLLGRYLESITEGRSCETEKNSMSLDLISAFNEESFVNTIIEIFGIDWSKKFFKKLLFNKHYFCGIKPIFNANPQKHAPWLVSMVVSLMRKNFYNKAIDILEILVDKINEISPIIDIGKIKELVGKTITMRHGFNIAIKIFKMNSKEHAQWFASMVDSIMNTIDQLIDTSYIHSAAQNLDNLANNLDEILPFIDVDRLKQFIEPLGNFLQNRHELVERLKKLV